MLQSAAAIDDEADSGALEHAFCTIDWQCPALWRYIGLQDQWQYHTARMSMPYAFEDHADPALLQTFQPLVPPDRQQLAKDE